MNAKGNVIVIYNFLLHLKKGIYLKLFNIWVCNEIRHHFLFFQKADDFFFHYFSFKLAIFYIFVLSLLGLLANFICSVSAFPFVFMLDLTLFCSFVYHHQQNKCYPKGVGLSEKLQLTAALCNEI